MSIWQTVTETMSPQERRDALRNQSNNTTNESCKHRNTYEDFSGGRKEICRDCGKVWK